MPRRGGRKSKKESVPEVKKTELDPAIWNKLPCPYLKDVLLTASASDAQQWRAASHRVKKFIEENHEEMPLPQPPKPKIEAPTKPKTELAPSKALMPPAKTTRIPEMIRSEMRSRLLRHPIKLTVDAESPVARYTNSVTKNGVTFSVDFEVTLGQLDALDVTVKTCESYIFEKMSRKNKKKNAKDVKVDAEVASTTPLSPVWQKLPCKFLKNALQCASANDAVRWLTVSKRVKSFIEENRAVMPLHDTGGTISISIGRFEMLLGHCPNKITKEIEIALPETKVEDASAESETVALQRMYPPSLLINRTSSWKFTASNLDFALMVVVKRVFEWYEFCSVNITNLPPSCFATIKGILEESAPLLEHDVGLVVRYGSNYDVKDLFLDASQIADLTNLLGSTDLEVTCEMKAPLTIPATLMEKLCIEKLTELWLSGVDMPVTAKHLESLNNLTVVDLRLVKPNIKAIEFHESVISPWFGGGWKNLETFTITLSTKGVICDLALLRDVVGRIPSRGKYYRDAAKHRRMVVDVSFSVAFGVIQLDIYHDKK